MAVPSTSVTTNEVRFSFIHVFQPYAQQVGQEPKFSTTILVPKSDFTTKAAMDTAVRMAIDQGVSKCWNGVRPPQPSVCIHDGDGVRPSDGQAFGEECKGHWVFTASSKQQPFVVDANVQNMINPVEVYSGCYGRASVNFFPYSVSGKKGIGCGLNGIQKLRDGESLGGRISAEEAFGAMAAAPAGTINPLTGLPL